jgi:hypothetical protein
MRVLFIGHYRENSGWANASRNLILAMDSVGIDVVPRAVKLNNELTSLPLRLAQLELKSSEGCDVCIQQVLPHHLAYGNFKKNIAFPFYEFGDCKYSNWNYKLSIMDDIWVSSKFTKDLLDPVTEKKSKIVPVPLNFEDLSHEKYKNPELEGNYVFYDIGDFNRRKNFKQLIEAYYLAFSYNEPVTLAIKTSKFNTSPEELNQIFSKEISSIKKLMKINLREENYPEIVLVTDKLSYQDYLSFHSSCDCFVTTSHGEAWNIPLQEACFLGKTHIVPKNMYDYTSRDYEFDTHKAPVIGMDDTFLDISSSKETWRDVDVIDLAKQMRKAYETRKTPKLNMDKYSYKNVGNMIKVLLNDKS